MPPSSDTLITLQIEKPAAGGRMIGRHEGQVVLVWGAIPGERVEARVERAGKGVLYADTVRIISPSSDRREPHGDWRCGGSVFAHVAYERQLLLKGEIVRDAFGRIGRMPLLTAPDVVGSPETGYRMRARLHAFEDRLGFYREGSHTLCDPEQTGQLLPETIAWIRHAEGVLRHGGVGPVPLRGLQGIELAENIAGDQRACHLELHAGIDASRFAPLAESLTGLSAACADRPDIQHLAGTPAITDALRVSDDATVRPLALGRHVRAFFQGNRFLLERLVRHVMSLVPDGPAIDLYAGVGLFGLSLAAAGRAPVTLVEGDPVSGADLQANAEVFGNRVRVERRSVEAYLTRWTRTAGTVIVDPPRTGMSKGALGALVAGQPRTLVYVSCDVATLARDARMLLDSGYELGNLTAFDLFPNTAHVETVAQFSR